MNYMKCGVPVTRNVSRKGETNIPGVYQSCLPLKILAVSIFLKIKTTLITELNCQNLILILLMCLYEIWQ